MAIVLGSPLVGGLRQALLVAFPRQYVTIITAAVVAGAALVLAFCFRAITTDRPRRLGTLGIAAALAVASFAALRSGNANVDAVEAFHFVEYGVLTLLFFRFSRPGPRWEAYVEAALATTAVGVADEWFQWFVPGRAGEWHDVLFNLLATACGLLLCLAVSSSRGSSDPPQGTAFSSGRPAGIRLGVRAALVILLAGAFLATIHLGAEIRDPEIGAFRSRFTGARLHELGAERTRQWAGGPPPVAGRYGREDQYEAEALWHVRRRNFGMDPDRQGDPLELDIAWHENLILERYFKVVLDAASTGGRTGHRLAPEQLTDLDARRAHRSTAFVSDAEAMPIYVWPVAAFWAVVMAAAAASLAAGAVLDRSRARGRT